MSDLGTILCLKFPLISEVQLALGKPQTEYENYILSIFSLASLCDTQIEYETFLLNLSQDW